MKNDNPRQLLKKKTSLRDYEDLSTLPYSARAQEQLRSYHPNSSHPNSSHPNNGTQVSACSHNCSLLLLIISLAQCFHMSAGLDPDCLILRSDMLNQTIPETISISLPYSTTNKIIGLGIFQTKQLEHTNHHVHYSGWHGPHGDSICRAQEAVIPTDTLDRAVMTIIPGPHSALMLDLTIIKNKNEVVCQFRIPSNKLENQEVCDNMLKVIATELGQSPVTVDQLEPKNGTNNVFLYRNALSLNKPREVLCKRIDTELTSISQKIQNDVEAITKELTSLDKTLGSHYIDKLDEQSKICGAGTIKDLLVASPEPSVLQECFQLDDDPPPHGRIRRSPMSLVEIGGGATKDTQMLSEINNNFNRLSRNEQQMFKKILTIAVEQKLESTILENQELSLTQLVERINGIEHRLNMQSFDDEFLLHLTSSARQTSNLLDLYKQRMSDFILHLSSSLQGSELKCSRLVCAYTEDTHLVSRVTGLEVFVKGKSLVAEAGFAPSCRMTRKRQISRYHLVHMETLNSTHLRSPDGDEVDIKCLKNYKKCSPEALRSVHQNDLIEGNLLLAPAKTAGFIAQCIKNTNLETPSGFVRCGEKRKTVFLPITLDSGHKIGPENIKIKPHRSPTTSLQQIAVELFRSNRKELDEARTIGHHAMNNLLKTDKVNSHHVSGFFMSFFVIGILSGIICISKCIHFFVITKCCTKRERENDQKNKDDSMTKSTKPSRLKAWFSKEKPEEVQIGTTGTSLSSLPPPPALGSGNLPKQEKATKYVLDIGSLIRSED